MVGTPIGYVWIHRWVVVVTDAVVASCSSSEDSAEDVALFGVVCRENGERSAIDGHGAVAVERVLDVDASCIATPCASSVELGDDDLAVGDVALCVPRVDEDVSTSHIGIVGESVFLSAIFEGEVLLVSHHSADHSCHISTLYHDVHVSIHGSLM